MGWDRDSKIPSKIWPLPPTRAPITTASNNNQLPLWWQAQDLVVDSGSKISWSRISDEWKGHQGTRGGGRGGGDRRRGKPQDCPQSGGHWTKVPLWIYNAGLYNLQCTFMQNSIKRPWLKIEVISSQCLKTFTGAVLSFMTCKRCDALKGNSYLGFSVTEDLSDKEDWLIRGGKDKRYFNQEQPSAPTNHWRWCSQSLWSWSL